MCVGSTWTQRASSFLQYKKVYTCHGHHVNGKAIMGGRLGGGGGQYYLYELQAWCSNFFGQGACSNGKGGGEV